MAIIYILIVVDRDRDIDKDVNLITNIRM
jgi:hypothetical protein